MAASDNSESRGLPETWAEYAREMQSRRPVDPVLYDSTRTGGPDNDLVIYNRYGSIGEWIQSDTYEVSHR